MKNIEKKRLNKLKKVNVPELFYGKFIQDLTTGTSSIADKLNQTTPTARGRGLSRVVENISNDEWNDLYQLAAAARATMIGADRETELRPTICAKALANRMEELGVDSPVIYTPKKVYTPKAVILEVDDELDAPSARIPATPLNIPRVTDLDEMSEDEQQLVNEDLQRFISG
jgi:hypothetical protein